MIVPTCQAFATKVADSLDIFSEDRLSLKLTMTWLAGFLLLLGDEVSCLGLVRNLELWEKSKSFQSRVLVSESTKTRFAMLVLTKLTSLDLSKLCVKLSLLEKMGEKHILLCKSNTFEKHPCLCCMDLVSKRNKLELDGKFWKWKGLSLGVHQDLQRFWNTTGFNFHSLEPFEVCYCMLLFVEGSWEIFWE